MKNLNLNLIELLILPRQHRYSEISVIQIIVTSSRSKAMHCPMPMVSWHHIDIKMSKRVQKSDNGHIFTMTSGPSFGSPKVCFQGHSQLFVFYNGQFFKAVLAIFRPCDGSFSLKLRFFSPCFSFGRTLYPMFPLLIPC